MNNRLLAGVFLGLATGLSAQATVRLPALVGDHMVLQREVPVPIWGWAAPGEQVTVTFRGRAYTATPAATGKGDDIHPANKQDVGHSLALVARQVAYGDKHVAAAGPTFQTMTVSGSQVRLRFANAGKHLQLRTGTTTPSGFAVAGADQQFHWASATLAGGEVVLTCAAVPTPVAVRYDWANNPTGNLYNKAGLPAVPFRTDQWGGAPSAKP